MNKFKTESVRLPLERMKVLTLLILLFSVPLLSLSQFLYNEDFNLPDGTTIDNGATAWSTSYSGGSAFEKETWLGEDLFFMYNLDSEGLWTSQSIDISAYGYAVIDVDGYIDNAGAGDYMRFYYSLNGDQKPFLAIFQMEHSLGR